MKAVTTGTGKKYSVVARFSTVKEMLFDIINKQ